MLFSQRRWHEVSLKHSIRITGRRVDCDQLRPCALCIRPVRSAHSCGSVFVAPCDRYHRCTPSDQFCPGVVGGALVCRPSRRPEYGDGLRRFWGSRTGFDQSVGRCPVTGAGRICLWYLHGSDDAGPDSGHAGTGAALDAWPGQLGDECWYQRGCDGRGAHGSFFGRGLALYLRVFCRSCPDRGVCHLVFPAFSFTGDAI